MTNPNYKYENGVISIKINDKWIQPSFNRYENIEPIGEPGANGVVIKATHKITKRIDAIKIWLPRIRNGKNEVREEQYEAEVQKIAKLNDPRIATIHDAWNENGCYCCSMEYIDGITYEKWLQINKNTNTRIEMLSRIFDAIVFYQDQGIIHGDIHSKNILIDHESKIHIIDFGTSSLSVYENQSIHRENYLMYELVEKTLADQFDKNAFMYRKYSIRGSVTKRDDIRNVIPIFFSKSVLSYLHLLELLLYDRDIINNSGDMYDYCRTIASGNYLSLDYFYSKITGKNNHKPELFSKVMYNCIEDEAYEYAQNDFNEALKMEFLSLYTYYNLVKDWILSGKIDETVIASMISSERFCMPQKVVDLFMKSSDLLMFHDSLLQSEDTPENANFIERNLRAALYNIIEKKSCGYLLHILRNINLQILELKQKKELCERITRISYNYCINNSIEYEFPKGE